MVVRDAVHGTLVSTAALAPIPRSGTTRFVVPAAWEDPDTYLATARFDATLALVRCRVSTGACAVAVRATAGPGRVGSGRVGG